MQETADPVQLITMSQQCHLCVQGKWLCLQVKHILYRDLIEVTPIVHFVGDGNVLLCLPPPWIEIDLLLFFSHFNLPRIYISHKSSRTSTCLSTSPCTCIVCAPKDWCNLLLIVVKTNKQKNPQKSLKHWDKLILPWLWELHGILKSILHLSSWNCHCRLAYLVCLNSQLKIVPNKSTIYSYLGNVCTAQHYLAFLKKCIYKCISLFWRMFSSSKCITQAG